MAVGLPEAINVDCHKLSGNSTKTGLTKQMQPTPQQVDTPSTTDSEVCATPQDTENPGSTPPPVDE